MRGWHTELGWIGDADEIEPAGGRRHAAQAAIATLEDLARPVDLGLTAASAAHREGFNTLIAQVTLEQVGLILSYDVTRLSRNCSDWYPLLDLCGYKGCLIADGDGVYDPATVNGRLFLGLKGTL